MTPGNLNLTMFRGVTFGPVVMRCQDANGNAVSLENYTPYAQARKVPCGPVVFNLAPSLSNGPNGEITIAHNVANLATFPTGSFGWDLVLQAPNGAVIGPIVAGRVSVSPIFTEAV